MVATAGRSLVLSADEIDMLRESLDYSIRNVRDWHVRHDSPETANVGPNKVEALTRLRQKLRAADEE